MKGPTKARSRYRECLWISSSLAWKWRWDLSISKNEHINHELFINIIIAERNLQLTTQRETLLQERARARNKLTILDNRTEDDIMTVELEKLMSSSGPGLESPSSPSVL